MPARRNLKPKQKTKEKQLQKVAKEKQLQEVKVNLRKKPMRLRRVVIRVVFSVVHAGCGGETARLKTHGAVGWGNIVLSPPRPCECACQFEARTVWLR